MIIIFLIFTLISIFLKVKGSKSFVDSVPFLIVTLLSWISFFTNLYLDSSMQLIYAYEVISILIVMLFGSNIASFLKLKMLGIFILTLGASFQFTFQYEFLYLYVILSIFIAFNTKLNNDKALSFPYLMFNLMALMKARELIETPFSIGVFSVVATLVILYLVLKKFQSLTVLHKSISYPVWLGLFTFSFPVSYLLIILSLILLLEILQCFEIKFLNRYREKILAATFFIILIPFSLSNLFLAIMIMSILVISLYLNRSTSANEEGLSC